MSGRALVGVLVAVVLAAGSVASVARADGDPGSDVLVYQDLFAGSSAGLSVQQQARLGDLLKAASAARFPIRVAIIASPSDLGAVTALWREPRSYARFLGLELSLAYKQRLLVVMPNGFGFNWPGHSTTAAYATLARIPLGSGVGLFAATQAAVRALAQSGSVKLVAPTHAGGGGAAGTDSAAGRSGVSSTTPGQGAENRVALLVAVSILLVGVILGVRAALRRRPATLRRRRATLPVAPMLFGDPLGAGLAAQDGVDGQAGGRAEAMQEQIAGVAQPGDEAQAEEVEKGEHDFGGAVGVSGVLSDWQLGVEDLLERVDRFALGDRNDLGAVLAVLVGDPVQDGERAVAIAELAGERIGRGGMAAGGGALPI